MAMTDYAFRSLGFSSTLVTSKWRYSKSLVSLPLSVSSIQQVRLSLERPADQFVRLANVTGAVSDPIDSQQPEIKVDEVAAAIDTSPRKIITWDLLWSLLLERHKVRMCISTLALIGCTTCTLSMPIYSGRFFELLIGVRPELLWQVLTKIGALYLFEPIFTVIFVINMNTIWEQVMSSLRTKIFFTVLNQKVEFFDRHKIGEVSALLTSDLSPLKDLVDANLSRDRGLRALSEVLGTMFILFSLAPQLAPILLVVMLSVSVFVAIYRRSTVAVFRAHGRVQASMTDCVTESVSAIRTVRSFGGEMRQMAMFGNQVLAYQKSGLKLGVFKSLNESSTRCAVYVSLLSLYFLGGNKVKSGELLVGTIVSFIGYTFTLTFAVQGLVNTLGDLRGTLAAVERINTTLSRIPVDQSLVDGLNKDYSSQTKFNFERESPTQFYRSEFKSTSNISSLARYGDVCLQDLHFSYPLRPDVEVLRGINLTLQHGRVTALVGSSGSGKSTIVQLLARFYEPTEGRITVAGEDIRTFGKTEWSRAVSIVNQDPVLFSLSVAENIAYGLPDQQVSKDDIIKAAKAANAHDFIVTLPQGYETLVGERGGLLSGGQRQRIAIARALLKDAPILILDEATSALDAVSEQLVQAALTNLMQGRTTLVIAHRLSTVQNADQIAVCADGEVAELGTHLELLAKNGQYASLVATQRMAFE